jgi:hypothetical protein
MNVEVKTEPGDYDALGEYLLGRAEENRRRRVRYISGRSIVVLVFIVLAVAFFQGARSVPTAVGIAALYVALSAAYVGWLHHRTRTVARRRVAEVVAEEKGKPSPLRLYSITEQGVGLREDGATRLAPWDSIADVVQTPSHIFVFGDREFPGVIPKRAFASQTEADQFFRLAHDYWLHRRRL